MPIRTVSEANSSEHWTAKAKRHRRQQYFVRLFFNRYANGINLPCIVTLTRLASRMLDDDNLSYSMKWIRDEISECLIPEKTGSYINKNGKVVKIKGRADSDTRIKWCYEQEKSPTQAIRVGIAYDTSFQQSHIDHE